MTELRLMLSMAQAERIRLVAPSMDEGRALVQFKLREALRADAGLRDRCIADGQAAADLLEGIVSDVVRCYLEAPPT